MAPRHEWLAVGMVLGRSHRQNELYGVYAAARTTGSVQTDQLCDEVAYVFSSCKPLRTTVDDLFSASFNCPLLHQLPFCPSISYAVPLAPPRPPFSAHTASTIPSNVSDTLISYLSNFTTTLTTLACGRDQYSPLVTCADCQAAYRTWLCAVSFPRCGEVPPSVQRRQNAQTPLGLPPPALQPVKAGETRNPILPAFQSDYQALLPCLETCNAADRACPTFLGCKRPLPRFTAGNGYGVGFRTTERLDGGPLDLRRMILGMCGAIQGERA